MKYCFLDAEYFGTAEPRLNLVSFAAMCYDGPVKTFERQFWLNTAAPYKMNEARDFFLAMIHRGHTFVSYSIEAEARALLTLFGSNREWLKDFKAIDLYLEYRCLLNQNHKLSYGRQYRNGKVITTKPPLSKWDRSENYDDESHQKPSYSLASAVYKLCDEAQIDTDHKDKMRDIIISGDRTEIEKNAAAILDYNVSDIAYLPKMFLKMKLIYQRRALEEYWVKARALRADYAVRTARMVELGYPVNVERLNNFTKNVKEILNSAAEDCNSAEPDFYPFRPNKKTGGYSLTEKAVRGFIVSGLIEGRYNRWRKTDSGSLSLSKDAFKDWFDSSSPGFPGSYCRYLKTKQSLNGFTPNVNQKRSQFSDYLGSDGRVRPYFGIYGAQTSRSQPGATGFIPLKAHWMRVFLEAPAGMALAGVDYASQEFLIAAILSNDSDMIDAYASGDVYLAFAKTARIVPETATKASHPRERDLCKALVLAISYDMSGWGLAPRLNAAAQTQTFNEESAQDFIDLFYDTYSDYRDWKAEIQREYREDRDLALPDGWVMSGDNDNFRSVGNFPVQGAGAVIMREAVRNAQDKGLDVILTLHDALYIQYRAYDTDAIETLKECMQRAFLTVMGTDESGFTRTTIPIRLEGESWAREYGKKLPKEVAGINFMCEYSDEKSKQDIERFRKFFSPNTKECGNGI